MLIKLDLGNLDLRRPILQWVLVDVASLRWDLSLNPFFLLRVSQISWGYRAKNDAGLAPEYKPVQIETILSNPLSDQPQTNYHLGEVGPWRESLLARYPQKRVYVAALISFHFSVRCRVNVAVWSRMCRASTWFNATLKEVLSLSKLLSGMLFVS